MRIILSMLLIFMVTGAVKSQNVFPTTLGSKVGIGTTTPGMPLEVNSADISDSLLLAGFFGPNNTAIGAATKLRFGAINSKGNSAEWRYIHMGNDSGTNRIDFGFRSYTNPVLSYTRNGFFGIGTTVLTHALTLPNLSSGIALYNTTDQKINFERLAMRWSSDAFEVSTEKGGSGTLRNVNVNGTRFNANGTFNTNGIYANSFGPEGNNQSINFGNYYSSNASSGRFSFMSIIPTINQTLTAGYSILRISPYEQTVGSGLKYLLDIGVNSQGGGSGTHTSKFIVTNDGGVGIGATSPTAQLHTTGSVRFAGLGSNDSLIRILVSDTIGNVAYRNISSLNSGSTWGSISGSLALQTDLQSELSLKAKLASPVLTGIPQAPTQPFGTNNLSIATTQFVYENSKANNDSVNANTGYTTLYRNKNNVKYFDTLPVFPSSIRNTLYNANRITLYDGNFLQYSPVYSNSVLLEDAVKFNNGYENTAFVSNGSVLSVERRKGSPNIVDTVYLRIYGSLIHGPYSMKFEGLSFPKGATVRFRDLYLNKITDLTDSFNLGVPYWYDFSTNASPSSYGDRFQILVTAAPPIIPTTFYSNNKLDLQSGILLNGVQGTLGQVLTAQGGKLPPIWSTPSSNGWSSTGNLGLNSASNFIGTIDSVDLVLRTNNTTKLLIGASGNVGIGTTLIADTAYKLFVEKGIRTRKLKVDATTVQWADYVFDKDYKLPTLKEVDNFIQQNKHLPGVPTTVEVNKNGIDVAESQAILLKKVEELTLYMIELNKKIDALAKENEFLNKRINSKNK